MDRGSWWATVLGAAKDTAERRGTPTCVQGILMWLSCLCSSSCNESVLFIWRRERASGDGGEVAHPTQRWPVASGHRGEERQAGQPAGGPAATAGPQGPDGGPHPPGALQPAVCGWVMGHAVHLGERKTAYRGSDGDFSKGAFASCGLLWDNGRQGTGCRSPQSGVTLLSGSHSPHLQDDRVPRVSLRSLICAVLGL